MHSRLGSSVPRSSALMFAFAVLILPSVARAITYTWIGGSDNWEDSTKWSPSGVPGPADDAVINALSVITVTIDATTGAQSVANLTVGCGSGCNIILNVAGGSLTVSGNTSVPGGGQISITSGVVTLDGPVTIGAGTLFLSGGTLTGAGDVDVFSLMDWTGGTYSGSGTTTFLTGGSLAIAGAVQKTLTTRAIVIESTGVGSWSTGGTLRATGGASITNRSTFTVDGNGIFDACCAAGTGEFINDTGATFLKIGTGTTAFQNAGAFINHGDFSVAGGTVNLSGGGSSDSAFDVSFGTFLNFGPGSTYVLDTGTTFTGTGSVRFTGATMDVAGTVSSSAATTALISGSLGGVGNLTVTGDLNWSGGTMQGSGETISQGAMTLFGATKTLNARILRNQGAAIWSAGQINSGNGGAFDNAGTFEIQNDLTFAHNIGGAVITWTNGGLLVKTAGTGTAILGAVLNNQIGGTVRSDSGTLLLNQGGTSPGGIFEAAAGATLEFSAGTHTFQAGTDLTGAGELAFTGSTASVGGTFDPVTTTITAGTASFDTPASSDTLNLSGGTMSGTDVFTAVTAFNWTGGTLTGGGETISPVAMAISGAAAKTLSSRILRNQGSAIWSAGPINSGNGGAFDNAGTFEIQGDLTFAHNIGGTVITWTNGGLLVKTAGTGTASLGAVLNNQIGGTVRSDSGTLLFNQGGTSPGGIFEAVAGATLEFSAGTHTFQAGTDLTGAGELAFTGSTASVGGTFDPVTTTITAGTASFDTPASSDTLNLSGGTMSGTDVFTAVTAFNWTGGTQTGGGETISPVAMAISGAAAKTLSTRILRNQGSAIWSAGPINSGNGGAFDNVGTFEIQNDLTFAHNIGGTVVTWTNGGLLVKTAGTGTASLGAVLNNQIGGTVRSDSGTLLFNQGGTSPGGVFEAAAGATLEFSAGTHTFQPGTDLTGAGELAFTGSTASVAGTFDPAITTISAGTASFNSAVSTGILNLSGGTMSGTDVFTAVTGFNWTAGILTGGGETVSQGAMAISGAATKTFRTRIVRNQGSAIWSAGQINSGDGGAFDNAGTFEIQDDLAFAHNVGGAAITWTNGGLLVKTAGIGTASLGAVLNNQIGGTVRSEAGMLSVTGGGTSPGGTFEALTGATVAFAGGTHTIAGTFTGAGHFDFLSGTVALNPPGTYAVDHTLIDGGRADFNMVDSSSSDLRISSGALGGSGDVESSIFTWESGTIDGSGEVRLLSSSGFTTTGVKTLVGRQIVSTGSSFAWTGGTIRASGGANITAAILTLTSDDSLQFCCTGGAPPVLEITNFLRKSPLFGPAPGVSIIDAELIGGDIRGETGTIRFTAGGDVNGDVTAEAGAAVEFGGGSFTLDGPVDGDGIIGFPGGTTTISGPYAVTGLTRINGGRADFDGAVADTEDLSLAIGNLGGTGELRVNGTFVWDSGTIDGTGSLATLGATALQSTGIKAITQRLWRNAGVAAWTDGQIRGSAGAILRNEPSGSFTAIGDRSIINCCAGGNAMLFDNQGSFDSTGGTTGSTFALLSFDNSGTTDISADVLTIQGPFTQSAGILSLSGGDLAATGDFLISGGAVIGDGILTGDVTSAGEISAGFSAGTITIEGDYQQMPAGALTVQIGGYTAGTEFDLLEVTGTATLDGTLNASVVSFTPSDGDTFQIINCGTCTGTFATENTVFGPNEDFDVLYTSPHVTLQASVINSAPVANADSYGATEDLPLTIPAPGVLANDSDPDGNPLTAILVSGPTSGTLTLANDGGFTFTPAPDMQGAASFTYQASDGTTTSSPASVGITVAGVNDPPDAVDDSVSSAPSGATFNVLSNDSDIDSANIFLASNTQPSSGSVSCSSNGNCTYVPVADFEGTTTFMYVVEDDSGATDSATVTITVSAAEPCSNDLPTLLDPDSASGPLGSPVTFRWTRIGDVRRYRLFLAAAGSPLERIATVDQPSPLTEVIEVTRELPAGDYVWLVEVDYPESSCPPQRTSRTSFTVDGCPDAVPVPLFPADGALVEASPVIFRWEPVAAELRGSLVRYELFLADGGAFELAGSVAGDEVSPSIEAVVRAGGSISWYVEAVWTEDCPRTRSRTFGATISCFPPQLAVQGSVTSAKPYQVRALLQSLGRVYTFEESLTEDFAEVNAVKPGVVDESGEFIFAEFEHTVLEPTPFFYRTRVAQDGCDYSEVRRIVVIPLPPPTSTVTDTVVQFGNEEEIRQQLFIASPEPDLDVSFTFNATTDRDWMRVEPSSGTIGPQGLTATVITNPVGLPVGTNTGTVMIEFTGVGGKTALSSHTTTSSTPVSVSLVTPVTSGVEGGPIATSLIIPAVAHASGIDSEWLTDVRLINLETLPQEYLLNLTVSGTSGEATIQSSRIELAAGETTALNDIVSHWYGLGVLPGEHSTGVLEIRPTGRSATQTPVTRTLTSVASSRTYNQTAAGTLGQYIPAIPFSAFVGPLDPETGQRHVLSIQQLAESTAYRTNLGVVEASGVPATVELRVFDESGTQRLTLPIALAAGEHRQMNQVLAKHGIHDLDHGRAELEVVSGSGRITAYASVIDNLSEDPLLVQGIDLATLGARRYVVPGVAHFDTGDARWRSDLQLFNAGASPVEATVSFFRQGATSATASTTLTLEPDTLTALGDILPSLFGQSNTGGAVQITTATDSELVVTARTYDQTDAGTFGQLIPAVTEEQAVGLGDRAIQVLQMEESTNIRTNLGIVEITGQPVTIELTAHAAESRVTPRVQITLGANEFRQINRVLRGLNLGTTYNGRIALRVVGGNGKIVAYASAVDNKTQDPTYVPGQ